MAQSLKLGRPKKRDEVGKWLKIYLAGGPRLQESIESAALALGFSSRTLKRAKATLGIESVRRGKVYYWRDPDVITEQSGSQNLVEAIDRLSRQIAKLVKPNMSPTAPATPPAQEPVVDIPTNEWREGDFESSTYAEIVKYLGECIEDLEGLEKYHGTQQQYRKGLGGEIETYTVDNSPDIARLRKQIKLANEWIGKKRIEEKIPDTEF